MKLSHAIAALCAAVTVPQGALAQSNILTNDQGTEQRGADKTIEAPSPPRPAPGAWQFTPFILERIELEGSTLPQAALAPLTAQWRGQEIAGDDLQQIADAVAALYARSDVALYTILIPQQTFAAGLLRLRVVEGRLVKAVIGGDKKAASIIAGYAAPLIEESPLRRSTFERALLLMSDVPGVTTQAGLAPAEAEDGAAILKLETDRTPFEHALGINNRGSQSLGRTQLQATASANSLLLSGDKAALTFATNSEFDRFHYYGFSHRVLFGGQGLSGEWRLSRLTTRPPNGIRGEADSAELSLAYPFVRAAKRNLFGGLSLGGINSDNAYLGNTIALERSRVLRASMRFARFGKDDAASFSAVVSTGLDDWGARASHPSTELGFHKINLSLGADLRLAETWRLRLSGLVQESRDALPASERLSIGGAQLGRAFESALTTGDRGGGGVAELAWRPKGAETGLRLSEIYVFADAARVVDIARIGLAPDSRELSSAGLGTKFGLGNETEIGIEGAKAIDAPFPGAGPDAWTFHIQLQTRL